jgi:hypothetical protein
MPKYLVTIYHPDDYDPAVSEDAAMDHDIDVVNEEMVAAGARIFVGGLHPANAAKSLRTNRDGAIVVSDGSYLKTNEHIGGLCVVEAANMDEALAWGKKATKACRTPVEVRPFH